MRQLAARKDVNREPEESAVLGAVTKRRLLKSQQSEGTYSKCHVTSNKANSNLECAEDKFQTRGWVQGCEK
jgi:hypothetical protein